MLAVAEVKAVQARRRDGAREWPADRLNTRQKQTLVQSTAERLVLQNFMRQQRLSQLVGASGLLGRYHSDAFFFVISERLVRAALTMVGAFDMPIHLKTICLMGFSSVDALATVGLQPFFSESVTMMHASCQCCLLLSYSLVLLRHLKLSPGVLGDSSVALTVLLVLACPFVVFYVLLRREVSGHTVTSQLATLLRYQEDLDDGTAETPRQVAPGPPLLGCEAAAAPPAGGGRPRPEAEGEAREICVEMAPVPSAGSQAPAAPAAPAVPAARGAPAPATPDCGPVRLRDSRIMFGGLGGDGGVGLGTLAGGLLAGASVGAPAASVGGRGGAGFGAGASAAPARPAGPEGFSGRPLPAGSHQQASQRGPGRGTRFG
ncbi:unnamed protein product [Prorocentrum cordatum]|uniref:Protein RFT1 homolog n=1 Tax=Prorocentrum cordatum TaxID=2364126 RepID=A0ABN9W794_9DINO|nr:unnamed protein product [Polarella glacialis]